MYVCMYVRQMHPASSEQEKQLIDRSIDRSMRSQAICVRGRPEWLADPNTDMHKYMYMWIYIYIYIYVCVRVRVPVCLSSSSSRIAAVTHSIFLFIYLLYLLLLIFFPPCIACHAPTHALFCFLLFAFGRWVDQQRFRQRILCAPVGDESE